jgi:beta-galactosidase
MNSDPHEEIVEAYSNCEEVELFLNDRSLGTKQRNPDDSPRVWKVMWEPGTLKAIGRNGDSAVASHELRTAGKAAKIRLTAAKTSLRPGWDNVTFVKATVTDNKGIPVPDASHRISFKADGPGIIAAVDNGDNLSHEPFQASERSAYQGRCYAIIRATADHGKITITATSPTLSSDTIILGVGPRHRQ